MKLEIAMLALACLFFISLVTTKASAKFGVPVLLLFLGVGMLFGDSGFGVEFQNFELSQALSTFALCIILFSGGLDTKIGEIRPIIKQGVVLATVGVLLTAFITGGFIWLLTNTIVPIVKLTFLQSLLLASIMSSTDSASVFAILRSKGISLKRNLRPLLEFESGSNDPMAYLITITIIQIMMAPTNPSIISVATQFSMQLLIGGVIGYFGGKLFVKIINNINLPNDSFYPIFLLTCSVFIFSATNILKGNGFLAVYIGGLIIGNSQFIMKRSSIKFFDGFAWLSQISMFLTLGLLVTPTELIKVWEISLIIGLFLIFFGRPITIFLCMTPFKMQRNDKLFLSWVGLRGAVPIVFAIIPLAAKVPNAYIIFEIVFFITLISLLLQGTFISPVANKLGVVETGENKSTFKDFDIDFTHDIKSVMTEMVVKSGLLANGNKLYNVIMPENTLIVMVKRGNKYFVPKGQSELEEGDKLLILTDNEKEVKKMMDN